MTWFVQTMFMGDRAETPEDLPATLDAYKKTADDVLEASELLADLDLEDKADGERAFERLQDQTQKPEFWAVRLGVFAGEAKRALEEGEAAQAAWAMQDAALRRCMLLFVRRLEELVWRGYRTFGIEELRAAIKAWTEAPAKTDEAFWWATLAEHSFVLSQLFAAPTIVIRGQAYVGGKTVDNREGQVTDFLAQNALTGAVALVEIKKPDTALLGRAYRNAVFAPSAELVGGVAQVEGNRDTLVKEFFALAKGRAEFFPYNPPGIVIAGRTHQLDTEDKRRSFELFRNGLKDVRVVTFDEVFGQARALLELVERNPAGNS